MIVGHLQGTVQTLIWLVVRSGKQVAKIARSIDIIRAAWWTGLKKCMSLKRSGLTSLRI